MVPTLERHVEGERDGPVGVLHRVVTGSGAFLVPADRRRQPGGRAGGGKTCTSAEVGRRGETLPSAEELRSVPGTAADLMIVIGGGGRFLDFASGCPPLAQKPSAGPLGKVLRGVLPNEQAEEHLRYVRRTPETREKLEVEQDQEAHGQETRFAGTKSPWREDAGVWVARHE
jgi:hypothetical protein